MKVTLDDVERYAEAVQKMVDPIKGQLENVDKAIDFVTKAREFLKSSVNEYDLIIINLSEKEGTWYTYNDFAPLKWTTQFQSYIQCKYSFKAYTITSETSRRTGAIHIFLDDKNPPFTVQRNCVYIFDGKNLHMWFNENEARKRE